MKLTKEQLEKFIDEFSDDLEDFGVDITLKTCIAIKSYKNTFKNGDEAHQHLIATIPQCCSMIHPILNARYFGAEVLYLWREIMKSFLYHLNLHGLLPYTDEKTKNDERYGKIDLDNRASWEKFSIVVIDNEKEEKLFFYTGDGREFFSLEFKYINDFSFAEKSNFIKSDKGELDLDE